MLPTVSVQQVDPFHSGLELQHQWTPAPLAIPLAGMMSCIVITCLKSQVIAYTSQLGQMPAAAHVQDENTGVQP